MKIKHISVSLLVILQACNLAEDPRLNSLSQEELLRQVMLQPIGVPSDKLSHVLEFLGDSESVSSTREIYYPTSGNVNYHVVRDHQQDTVSIGLNFFSGNGQVQTSMNFTFIDNKPVWHSTREYSYNGEDLLEEIIISTATDNEKVLARFMYNFQKLLTRVEYPFHTGTELELFEYDMEGRILNHWKSTKGQEESKVDYLVYRYNGEQLEAKETGPMGKFSVERQDAFQYFYDQKGRLAIQKEFDPYFGFQMKGKIEYFYHEGINK